MVCQVFYVWRWYFAVSESRRTHCVFLSFRHASWTREPWRLRWWSGRGPRQCRPFIPLPWTVWHRYTADKGLDTHYPLVTILHKDFSNTTQISLDFVVLIILIMLFRLDIVYFPIFMTYNVFYSQKNDLVTQFSSYQMTSPKLLLCIRLIPWKDDNILSEKNLG